MNRDSLTLRSSITLVVCLLILGVISLATRAKTSQYCSGRQVASYLSKSTKMSDSGQRLTVLPQPRVMLPCAERTSADLLPPAAEPPRSPCAGFLESLHFRPPPPLA